ncbi:MAG: hypothetical protein ACLRFE_03435 [Clostridia bacterium]
MEQNNIYAYENRQEIYNEARDNFLQGKPFEINGKMCESLIEVMHEDVAYLFSLLEDVKEVIIEDEKGRRKDAKVGNTPLNNQLANTISIVNKRVLDAEKLKRELGNKMRELLDRNKEKQVELDEQIKSYGCVTDEMFEEHEKIFNDMSELLNEFVNSDTIAIQFVEYRNSWLKQYESYLNKHRKNN